MEKLGGAMNSEWVRLALQVLDFLLVYYLLYRILLLIKGTRAVQMLVGLFVIIGAYFASRVLGLSTLHWLIGNFISYSFIFIIIVLFQHDIRRGLQRLGGTHVFSGADMRAGRAAIEELVKGTAALAARRLGALIVVERGGDLEDFVKQGTPVDATLSRELLLALFQHASPLHDGAVVVRGNRLAAAGVFLPLTTQDDVDPDLGTRHRAALGLTEEVDAVVLVVSEERGEISLVVDGRIRRGLDQATLRRALEELLVSPRGGWLARFRRHSEVR